MAVRDKLGDVKFQVWLHRMVKYFWLAIAIFGILPLDSSDAIRNSIPILFFISVYANYVSHWSTERALEAQLEARELGEGNP